MIFKKIITFIIYFEADTLGPDAILFLIQNYPITRRLINTKCTYYYKWERKVTRLRHLHILRNRYQKCRNQRHRQECSCHHSRLWLDQVWYCHSLSLAERTFGLIGNCIILVVWTMILDSRN